MIELRNVVNAFAERQEVSIFRPSTRVRFLETIHIFPFSLDSVRISHFYDRSGSIDPDSILMEGDIVTFSGRDYIVASLVRDEFFGQKTRDTVHLTITDESLPVKRKTISITNGAKTSTLETVTDLEDIHISFKPRDESEYKALGTFVMSSTLSVSAQLADLINVKDVVETKYGEFRFDQRVMSERGLATWIMTESSDV